MTNQTLHLQEWVNKKRITPQNISHSEIHNFIMKEFPIYDYVEDLSFLEENFHAKIELNIEREETIRVGEEEYHVTLSELENKKYMITSYNRYLRK